ncbi:hypothetical protein F4780DRAFT_798565 [Xylariomycetidae sp. FL0641]|nr:hypothetical protein F4780DRAFT_798565 [Xylariomycetidae sp. FL0641]
MTDAFFARQTDRRSESPPRRQRACLPCKAAKARCNFTDERMTNECERCRKLEIHCEPQTTPSLRRPARRIKGTSSVPNLDTTNGHHLPSTVPLVAAQAPQHGRNPAITHPGNHEPVAQPPVQGSTAHPAHDGVPKRPRPVVPGFGLTWGQADQALEAFKTKYSPSFPFVTLEPELSATQLFQGKPLLFRAIMLCAANLGIAKQREIKRSINAWIGQHVLVQNEQSIGVLQGLLAYIAWGKHEFFTDRNLTQLIYLAVGHAHSLGLTRKPLSSCRKITIAVSPKDVREGLEGQKLSNVTEESHTPEERRALLGCYYLHATNSLQYGRQTTIPLACLDHCLTTSEHPVEYPSDFHMVKMTRFQMLIERISDAFPEPNEPGEFAEFTEAIYNQMQSYRMEVNQLFGNVARENPKLALLWCTHSFTITRIYYPATYMLSPADERLAELQVQCMMSSLQAANTYFATVLAVSADTYSYCAFTALADLTFMVVAVSRLLLVDLDGWDLPRARRLFDFSDVLDRLVARFIAARDARDRKIAETAAAFPATFAAPADDKDDPFPKYIAKLQRIKAWVEEQMAAPTQPDIGVPNDYTPVTQDRVKKHFFGLLGDSWNVDF